MAGKVYETAIRIGAKLSATFKAETYSASAAIARIGAESKKLTAASKGAAQLAQLGRESAAAAAAVAAAADEEKRLGDEAKAAGKPTAELKAKMREAAAAAKAAERELARTGAAAAKVGATLQGAGVDTRNLAGEQYRLAAALAATERRMGIAKGIAQVGASARNVVGHVKSLAEDALKIATGAGAAAVALGGLVKHTIEAGDEIGDTAANLGIGTKALQELRFAAERGGSSAEDLDKGLAKYSETVGDALGGNKAARASFAALGISMRQLRAATPEQRFGLLADAVAKIPDPARRAAAASNFLGKASKSMVDLLGQGSEGIDKLRRDAVGVLSDDAIAGAGAAKNAMQSAGAAFRGVTNILGAELLPVATRVLERFTSWVVNNQGAIQAWAFKVSAWIEGKAIPALEKFAPRVFVVAERVGSLIEKLSGAAGGFENVGIAMAALRAAPLAASVVGLTKDIVVLTAKMVAYASATWGAGAAQTALGQAQASAGGGALVPGAAAGAGGKLAGAAATAGSVLAAGAAGYAIGTALDQWLGASDMIAKAFAGPAATDVGSGEIPVFASGAAPRTGGSAGGSQTKIDKIEIVVPPGMSADQAQAFTQKAIVEAMAKHAAEQRRLALQ